MLDNLENKVIIITGASSGLGKSLAIRLSSEKAKLVLLSRNAEKLQNVARQISENGSSVSCFSCNVVDIQQIKNAVDYVTEAYGTIDILINCAAIWNESNTDYFTEQKVRELFDVNSIGVISVIASVLPVMRKKSSGQIINIISMAGVDAYKNSGVFSATKFAVRGYTESLQKEIKGSGIKVTGLYPGEFMDGDLFNTIADSNNVEERPIAQKIAEIIAFVIKQPQDIIIDHLEISKS